MAARRHTFISRDTELADSTDYVSGWLDAADYSQLKIAVETISLSSGNFTVSIESKVHDHAATETIATSGTISAVGWSHDQANSVVVAAEIFGFVRIKLNLASGSATGANVEVVGLMK